MGVVKFPSAYMADGFDDLPSTGGVPVANDNDAIGRTATTPSEVVQGWGVQGAITRVPTGIGPLDRGCRGGLPIPWRVLIVGAPSAGKTAFMVIVANYFVRSALAEGLCVGILAVDEDPDDIVIRLAQIAGFTVEQAERRDPEMLSQIQSALQPIPMRLYGAEVSIEAAAGDLASWAASEGRKAALFIDSIQAVRSDAAVGAKSEREVVAMNMQAVRRITQRHRMLTVASSEANRATYRSEQAEQDDLATGRESSAIEYGAQTQLVLRTPKGHPDVVHVRVPKNRRADTRFEFWLRLDRERQTLTECDDPVTHPSRQSDRDAAKTANKRTRVESDAVQLAELVRHNGGLSTRALRALAAGQLGWGKDRIAEASALLGRGTAAGRLVDRGGKQRSVWYLEGGSCSD